MNDLLTLTITQLNEKLKHKEIRVIDIVEACFAKIEKNKELNALITLNKEEAIKEALLLDDLEVNNMLFGIPIVIKDNIMTKDLRTTCASKMLENFIPLYDATVVEKVKEKHMIIIGKANMDEFAMGSTSQTSYFKPPKNPWNLTKVTGGSSGGSAAVIASQIVPLALGTDTGGSIRQPASYCGLVGMKPTYGRVSRHGLIAFASSLDQIGPMTRNVYENALLLQAIAGRDNRDLTSSSKEVDDFTSLMGKDIKGMKIGVPNFFMSDIVSHEIREAVEKTIIMLEKNGAIVERMDISYLENAVTLYQIIAMGEASTNLSRFDGVRYGYSHPYNMTKSLDDLYGKTRAVGFGEEVKRRIMVGSYLLSGENAKIYSQKALSIRKAMTKSFEEAFTKYDLIIGPTTTTVAYDLGTGLTDPSQTFLDDVLVIPVNMAGLPGLSLPIAFNQAHMPIGLQIIASHFEEAKIYQLAAFIEQQIHLNVNIPEGGLR